MTNLWFTIQRDRIYYQITFDITHKQVRCYRTCLWANGNFLPPNRTILTLHIRQAIWGRIENSLWREYADTDILMFKMMSRKVMVMAEWQLTDISNSLKQLSHNLATYWNCLVTLGVVCWQLVWDKHSILWSIVPLLTFKEKYQVHIYH